MSSFNNSANHTIARIVVEDRDTSIVNGGSITAAIASSLKSDDDDGGGGGGGGRRSGGSGEKGRGRGLARSNVEDNRPANKYFAFRLTPGKSNL